MPLLNGYEMTLKIKDYIQENNLIDIPIISFSASLLDDQELELQKKFKFDDQLTKPSSKYLIQEKFSQYLPFLSKL